MHLHQPTTRYQSGFSVIEVLLVVMVVAAFAVSGFLVYQRHKSTNIKNSAATSTSQTTTQPKSTSTQQIQQTATQYLTITQWGVKKPLSSTISDAYYVVPIGIRADADGQPTGILLGLTSLNRSCGALSSSGQGTENALGEIVRSLPTDKDAVSGKLYTQLNPDGVTIGGYYYGYTNSSKNKTCASATTLQSIDSAFGASTKNMVTAAQYLNIIEWGIRLTLDSTTASLYYYIKPNLPNVAYVSLKTASDIALNCAADKISLGAIVRLTPAEYQRAPDATYSIPGTIRIGNYWYGYSTPQAGCIDSATENTSISQALPAYSLGKISDAFNTLVGQLASEYR